MQRTLDLIAERLHADTAAPTPKRRQVVYAAASSMTILLLGCSLTLDMLARHNGLAAALVSATTTALAAGAAIITLRLVLARRHAHKRPDAQAVEHTDLPATAGGAEREDSTPT